MDIEINKIEVLESYFPKTSSTSPKEKKVFELYLLQLYFQTIGRLFPKMAGKLAYRLFTTPMSRAGHKQSDSIQEKARVYDILYSGRLLKVYEWGEGEQIILLVHGWQSRGTALRSFVAPLLRRGYRVIAFDGPAHGNSGGKQTHLSHFAGAIKAMLNRFGKVDGIIAHSFGGAASVFALGVLDQSIKVDKLVLVGVPSSLQTAVDGFYNWVPLPGGVKKDFEKRLEAANGITLKEADVGKIGAQIVRTRSLIIHDLKDEIVPVEEARRIIRDWPNARLVLTEGYGHYKLMKNPDVVGRIISFLNPPVAVAPA